MRLQYPTALLETIEAGAQSIRERDPRFEARLALTDYGPVFELVPNEPVEISLAAVANAQIVEQKFRDLIDKGILVKFEPGEIQILGSELFEEFGTAGCQIQTKLDELASMTLVIADANGEEIASLRDFPGRISGGRSEVRFHGEWPGAPLVTEVGPLSRGADSYFKLGLEMARWNGQPLRLLAYFDRIWSFYNSISKATEIRVEIELRGNKVFRCTVPLSQTKEHRRACEFMESLWKSRQIAERFSIEPGLSLQEFNKESRDIAEELYGIFFQGGWQKRAKGVKISGSLVAGEKKKMTFGKNDPVPIRIEADCTSRFLGHDLKLGRLVYEFSQMVLSDSKRETKSSQNRVRETVWEFQGEKGKKGESLVLVGTDQSVISIRQLCPESAA